jgi:hypothetical protein
LKFPFIYLCMYVFLLLCLAKTACNKFKSKSELTVFTFQFVHLSKYFPHVAV